MNIKALSAEIGIDAQTYHVLLAKFYERTVKDVADILGALHDGDFNRAASAAHSIKGSAGNLAIMDIHALAGEIERKARDNMLQEIPPAITMLGEKLEIVRGILY